MASRDSMLARALMDAQLRYQPQLAALDGLLSQRRSEYVRGRRVAASTARGITASIDQTQPQVAAAFDQALASAGAQRGALGVGADDPQAAAFTRRVGEAKGTALANLLTQKQQAVAGQSYANSTARSEYFADKDKIQAQMRGLLGESAAYATQRGDELTDADTKRRQEQQRIGISAGSLAESQRHNRAAEATARQRAAQSTKKAKVVRWAPPAAQAAAKDAIEAAMTEVQDLRLDEHGKVDPRVRRSDIIALLIRGEPASKDRDGNTVPAIPKLPADLVRAAVNLSWDGTLSRGDVERLHARRIRVKPLGYSTRKPGQKPPQSRAQALITGGATGALR